MGVAVQVEILVELKAVKSFVSFHFSEGVLLVRALGYDLAVLINLSDGITKSIKLSQSSGRNFEVISNDVGIGRVASLINDNALSFSEEVCVDLLEDGREVGALVSSIELTELPGGIGAPEEVACGSLFLSNVVDSNGNKIVVFNS